LAKRAWRITTSLGQVDVCFARSIHCLLLETAPVPTPCERGSANPLAQGRLGVVGDFATTMELIRFQTAVRSVVGHPVEALN